MSQPVWLHVYYLELFSSKLDKWYNLSQDSSWRNRLSVIVLFIFLAHRYFSSSRYSRLDKSLHRTIWNVLDDCIDHACAWITTFVTLQKIIVNVMQIYVTSRSSTSPRKTKVRMSHLDLTMQKCDVTPVAHARLWDIIISVISVFENISRSVERCKRVRNPKRHRSHNNRYLRLIFLYRLWNIHQVPRETFHRARHIERYTPGIIPHDASRVSTAIVSNRFAPEGRYSPRTTLVCEPA